MMNIFNLSLKKSENRLKEMVQSNNTKRFY